MGRTPATLIVAMSLLLASCGGGGGGGPVSTPPPAPTPSPSPTPSPTPTPPPSPQALGAASGQTNFANLATRTTQQLVMPDDTVTTTSADTIQLSFSFDAENNVYTVSGGGNTSAFGEAQFLGYDSAGDALFSRETDDGFDLLTLFNPARMGGGTQYVTAGLWQRRMPNGTASSNFEFDVFVYGFPTEPSNVPITGTATYDIHLFGVASPIGTFPRSVVGDGTFSLDFAQGLFAMSGEAGEYNNEVDYSTCCASWRGAGYLASSGGLSGNLAYDGRDRFTYQATVAGGLFGPSGSEVGGRFVGGDGDDATFTGIFAGTREGSGIDVSLHVLGEAARSFYTIQGSTAAFQAPGDDSSSGAAYYFPAENGQIEFGSDRSVTLRAGISDDRFENVTFTEADLVAARSDARFAAYEVNDAHGNYQLELFQPGSRNPEIELTYSSFGHWQETRAINDADRLTLSTWFSYGARTAGGTLPTTGTAHYTATILGSGERYTDTQRVTLSGTSSIDIDFGALRIQGTLDANALTASNETIDLPELTFGGAFESNGFNALLESAPGHAPGSIRGSLYGPGGEEIGGSFDFATRIVEGGEVDAAYSGVFYGKRD